MAGCIEGKLYKMEWFYNTRRKITGTREETGVPRVAVEVKKGETESSTNK